MRYLGKSKEFPTRLSTCDMDGKISQAKYMMKIIQSAKKRQKLS